MLSMGVPLFEAHWSMVTAVWRLRPEALLTAVALKLPLQVCDVLVWPDSTWLMPDGRSGVKLTALHVFLH